MREFQLKNKGTVRLYQEGLLNVIEASVFGEQKGIVRLAALCGSNVRPIGVLMPKGSEYTLKRRLTRSDWTAMGLTEITGFTLLPEGNYAEEQIKRKPPCKKQDGNWFRSLDELKWQLCAAPGACFADSTLSRAADKAKGVLEAEKEGLQYLAIPMDNGCPFPPLPVFRFGEPVQIRGKSYVVFRLSEGQLVN